MSVPTSAAAMAAAAAAAVSGVSFPGMGGPGAAIPGATRIVVLADAVTLEEISIEEEYSDILEVRAGGWAGGFRCWRSGLHFMTINYRIMHDACVMKWWEWPSVSEVD